MSTAEEIYRAGARSTASFPVQGESSSGRTIMAENEGTARLVEGEEPNR